MKNIFIKNLILISSLLFISCSNENEINNNTIKIAGSTSVAPVVKNLKFEFEKKFPNINIEIQETGSSAGISSLIENVAGIGMSSRELKGIELTYNLEETIIAYDGISIVVNPDNPINNLSSEDVRKIFSGKINNWNEVGGIDKEIIVLSREEGSGTRSSFEELLDLEEDIYRNEKKYKASLVTLDALYQNSTGAIKKYISTNNNAIGYISFGNLDETLKAIDIDNISPTEYNVINNSYKIYRPFIFCKNSSSNESANIFINYILSEEGQKIISESNYIKVK